MYTSMRFKLASHKMAGGIALTALACLNATSTRAAPDILLQAVGFALTGSDDAKVQVIDRPKCVFGLDGKVFHLNNVQVDRVRVQAMNSITGPYVAVELHGSSTVYEATEAPIWKNGPSASPEIDALGNDLRKTRPEFFIPNHVSENETTLTLYTREQDRVVRAWKYIYANGCTGAASPF